MMNDTLCCTVCGTPILTIADIDGLPIPDQRIDGAPLPLQVRIAPNVYEWRCKPCVRG